MFEQGMLDLTLDPDEPDKIDNSKLSLPWRQCFGDNK